MSDFADYLETAILAKCFRGQDFTTPTSTTVHLHTGDPSEAGDQNEVDVADWTDYSEQTVNVDGATDPYWSAIVNDSDSKAVENVGVVDFGNAAIVNPVVVSHVTVRDHLGNVLYVGALPSSLTVNNGNPVSFPDGTLVLKTA